MTRLCEVPNCITFAERQKKTCSYHANARTAKDLRLSEDAKGLGGETCLGCRRKFREDDYVIATAERRPNMKKGGKQLGYRHVACEPPSPRPSRKAIRESIKPLLEMV